MRLFGLDDKGEPLKVPVYLAGIKHRLERRRDDEVKVYDLALTIDPFTPELASELDPELAHVKRALFNMTDATPIDHLRGVEFDAPDDPQLVTCYATKDTKKHTIKFDQVKVRKMRARGKKDGTGWVLCIHVTVGPLSRAQLVYISDLYTKQAALTWEPTEPALETEDDGAGDAIDATAERPEPEWDDEPKAPAQAAAPAEEARPTARRHRTRKAAAEAKQRAAKADQPPVADATGDPGDDPQAEERIEEAHDIAEHDAVQVADAAPL